MNAIVRESMVVVNFIGSLIKIKSHSNFIAKSIVNLGCVQK